MKTLAVVTVCFCVIACIGFPKTIQVPGDYWHLQDAIDAAEAGDEILLGARTFRSGVTTRGTRIVSWTDSPGLDRLVIEKSITIRGVGVSETYLDGGAHSSITISSSAAAQVTIKDLTIGSTGRDLPRILIRGNVQIAFEDVVFKNAAFELSGEVDVYIHSARFTQRDSHEAAYIMMEDLAMLHLANCILQSTRKSVHVNENSKLYVDQSELSSGGSAAGWCTGISIAGGQAELANSKIHGSDPYSAGVSVSDGGKAVLKDCSIRTDGCAVSVSGGSVEAIRSTISSKEHTGILLSSESSGVVDLCHIEQSGAGINVRDGADVRVSGTAISNNSVGIQLSGGETIVEGCEIHSNGEAGISLDGTARAIIADSTVKNNDGWGIAARGSAVAVGWGNSVTGNQRDLFGVSDWLIKPRLASDQATVVVPRETPTIEEAVYRVAEGGTIVIEPGDYSDVRVAIYKRINLEGQEQDVVVGGLALFNELGDVHVANLAIVGNTKDIGILVPNGNHLRLADCVVSNWYTGLHLLPGSTATVSNSTISENWTGIRDSSSALVLRGCSMSLNGEHAISSSSEELRIEECSIFDNGKDEGYEAIWFSGKDAYIKDSIIKGNVGGVNVQSGTCNIESCLISDNNGGVSSGGTLTIRGSRIMNNTAGGIYAWRGDLTIFSTEVAFNKYGVVLTDSGEDIEKLIAQKICIHGNSSADLLPPIEQYPWPAEFEECVQLDEVSEPPLIEDVYADVTGEGEATLSWTYPVDLELSRVAVRRSATGWPTNHTDGILVHEVSIPEAGSKAEYRDTDLVADRTYYYAVFTSGSDENWNDRVEQGKNAAAVAIPPAMEDSFPSCVLQLRDKASRLVVTEVCVGTTFEIYVGDSEDDRGIEAVRFSSDESQDGNPTGEWTDWYDWNTSSGDWDSALRVKKWSFATGGQKEVWAEVKDTGDNVSQCSANIFAHPGYAIIVAGQGGWRDKRGLDHCANNAYRALRNLGFTDDHIFYLNSSRPQDIDGDGDDEVDAVALLSEFTDTLHEVRDRIGSNPIPLILYFAGHGAPDCFIFDEDNSEQGYLWVSATPAMTGLQELLDQFNREGLTLAIIGSCYSGCFITSSEESGGNISTEGRIIITANHDDSKRILWGWARSSDCLWGDLMRGSSVKEVFVNRTLPIDKRRLWLDDNGDAVGHPPHALETDGELAAGTKIGVPGSDNLKLKPWAFYWIRSPGELCLYDAQGQVTGLVNGEVREEIPNSLYDEENKIVALFSPTDSYYCQVVGADEGAYELDATSIENGKATTFAATDIPTIPGAVHRYTIDWNALAKGDKGVVLQIDSDGEGTFEKTSQVGSELDGSILAVAEITPPQDGATNTWLWVIFGVCGASILIIAVVVSVKWTNWRKSSKGH